MVRLVPAWHQPPTLGLNHPVGLSFAFFGITHMEWLVGAIKVKPVKWKKFYYPICNIPHVFIVDDEITGSATSRADLFVVRVAFKRSVLVKMVCHPARYVLAELVGAKAVGQPNSPKIIDDRIKDIDS